MRRPRFWSVAAVVAAGVAVVGAGVLAQEGAKPAHVMVMPADLQWGEPPPVFEKGMSFTVVAGDPGASGIFVVRLKMPAGYKIAPHWHPTDEHVTVLQGTLGLGMGDTFDKTKVKELAAGGSFGSIMGRNAFQRPRKEAVALLKNVMAAFAGEL